MIIYRFDAGVGKPIDQFGSVNITFSRIAFLKTATWISCMNVGKNGVVGYHQATIPQLFLVVEGEGWVRGESAERHSIKAGQAAFWAKGEYHESGSKSGMTAILIEVENETFDVSAYLQEL
jgi:hypothetical protein